MTDHKCRKCDAALTTDEISLHKKLIGRAQTRFFCLDCLAEFCNTSRESLEEMIEYYHETGECCLFAKYE